MHPSTNAQVATNCDFLISNVFPHLDLARLQIVVCREISPRYGSPGVLNGESKPLRYTTFIEQIWLSLPPQVTNLPEVF